MESWKSLIVVLTFLAIACFSLLNFVYIMQISNNQENTIFSDGSPLSTFNSSLGENLDDFSNKATEYKNATDLEQNSLKESTGDLTIGSIFTSGVRFSGFIYGFTSSVFKLFNFIGVPVVLLGTLTALLIVIVALLWWRLIKQGI